MVVAAGGIGGPRACEVATRNGRMRNSACGSYGGVTTITEARVDDDKGGSGDGGVSNESKGRWC